jgi:ABC-2 type transport system ATP-binding protein
MTGLQLTDERALYWRLTGRENLQFFGVMAGLSAKEARARAELLLERFNLAGRDRRVFGYSSGMRVRLGLARALIAQPRLLILDEPSRSLDPVASSELQHHLRELAEEGTTVVLSSHRLDEVEAICHRVLVLIDGRQRAWTTTAELAEGANSAADSLRRMLGTEPIT